MSISGLLIRFAGLYVVFMVAVAAAFGLLGMKANSGANAGALIGTAFAVSMWFCVKNKRTLEATEKRSAFLGMLAIDLVIQVAVVLAAGLDLGTVLMATAFIGLLHAIGIWFAVGFAARQYSKQAARNT